MDTGLKKAIWRQFGAAIEYLATTVRDCPDELWHAPLWRTPNMPPEMAQFWYVTYHSLFWLDLYLTGTEDGFIPPAPFLLIEQYRDGPIPERAYTKAELQDYLEGCRQRCWTTIESLTDEAAQRWCVFSWGECSFQELLIYNLRHVHGHASQLNMLLGQNGVVSPDYRTQVKYEAP